MGLLDNIDPSLLAAYGGMGVSPYLGAPGMPQSFADRFQPAVDQPLADASPPLPRPTQATAGASSVADGSQVPVRAPVSLVPDRTIAVGDSYQMPQFGTPPAGVVNASAQGAGAPGGATPAVAPPAIAGGPSLQDRLRASMQSMAAGNGLLSGLTSFAAGQRTDPQGAAANQTVQALLARGVSPADAQAAVNNPVIMRALINQVYGASATAPPAIPTRAAPTQGDAPAAAPAAPAPTLPQRPRVQLQLPQSPLRGVTQGGIRWGVM